MRRASTPSAKMIGAERDGYFVTTNCGVVLSAPTLGDSARPLPRGAKTRKSVLSSRKRRPLMPSLPDTEKRGKFNDTAKMLLFWRAVFSLWNRM